MQHHHHHQWRDQYHCYRNHLIVEQSVKPELRRPGFSTSQFSIYSNLEVNDSLFYFPHVSNEKLELGVMSGVSLWHLWTYLCWELYIILFTEPHVSPTHRGWYSLPFLHTQKAGLQPSAPPPLLISILPLSVCAQHTDLLAALKVFERLRRRWDSGRCSHCCLPSPTQSLWKQQMQKSSRRLLAGFGSSSWYLSSI